MKKLVFFVLFSIVLFACGKEDGHYYAYMYIFNDESIVLPVTQTVTTYDINILKEIKVDGGKASNITVEVVPDGTTAVEGIDFTLSAKNLEFKKDQRWYNLQLSYTSSFTAGKTLRLKLIFPSHPQVLDTLGDTTVITAR